MTVTKLRQFFTIILFFFNILVHFQKAMCQSGVQKSIGQQIQLHFDNNFFLFNGDDGYYTNGTFAKYSRVKQKPSGRAEKKISSFEIGQKIFIAHSRKILPSPNVQLNIPGGIDQIDRPIAGYLFGKMAQASFYKNRKMMEWGVSIGSIGENSLSQSMIELWHEAIGVKDYWNWVWDYQVKNEVGANLHGTFAYSFLPSVKWSFIQVTPITQASVGTIFIDVAQSLLFQFGKLRPMSSSSLWSSRLETKATTDEKPDLELFIFYKPDFRYQFYNATIQGGVFNSDKGPILSEINPMVLSHELGLQLSSSRFSLKYSMTFQSKEAKSQFFNQSYASIACSFSY